MHFESKAVGRSDISKKYAMKVPQTIQPKALTIVTDITTMPRGRKSRAGGNEYMLHL